MRGLAIPNRLVVRALAHFIAATAGRNMTKAAYVAVTIGVGVMEATQFVSAPQPSRAAAGPRTQ